MTEATTETGLQLASSRKSKGSKAAAVLKLLSRTRGATVAELITESGWQAHTVRAHLSGLRKKHTISKEVRRSGEATYRVAAEQAEEADDEKVG